MFKYCGSMGININFVVELVITAVAGFGIALYFAQTFQNTLTGTAQNAIGNIVNGTNSGIGNVLVPIISIVFIFLLYDLAVRARIIKPLGGGGRGE